MIASYPSFTFTVRFSLSCIGLNSSKYVATSSCLTKKTPSWPVACLNVPDTSGIILHSDLGSQYTSQLFESYLTNKGIKHSFSRKGNPYDNACIESFHSVLKKEEIYLHKYNSFEKARMAIFEYIESWYNRKRMHSALDYKTPQQVEDEIINAA